MNDLQAQAKAYAKDILNNSDSEIFSRQEMYYALCDAYEQGWIECEPETLAEFLNEAPDCRYFHEGYCSKGLPDTFCERDGCAAYCPKRNEY